MRDFGAVPWVIGAVLSVIPVHQLSAADEYRAGRYRITDVTVSQDEDSCFMARATVTNAGATEDPTPVLGVYFLRGERVVGEAEGVAFEGFEGSENEAPDLFEAGAAHTVRFIGSSHYDGEWDGLRFEVFAGEDEP